MPAAHLQTQILAMSDLRRILIREIHDLSVVNFQKKTTRKKPVDKAKLRWSNLL